MCSSHFKQRFKWGVISMRKGLIFRSLNKHTEITEEPGSSWIFWIFQICLEVCTHTCTPSPPQTEEPRVPRQGAWRCLRLRNGWGSKSRAGGWVEASLGVSPKILWRQHFRLKDDFNKELIGGFFWFFFWGYVRFTCCATLSWVTTLKWVVRLGPTYSNSACSGHKY